MKAKLFAFTAQRRKAIVGALVSGLAAIAARKGFSLTTDQVAAVTAALTALTVHFVPNADKP